ncbi:MAG: PIN domain-containing protein [Methanospirillaceae archaeon]|nr:PIN domain-containing protein [Methanospirillaceae archaeon]
METIQSSSSLIVIPIDRQILVEAARIRAESNAIHLPDAIHLATAHIHHYSSF